MSLHIGTSGWSYDHWQGVLYPPATPVGKRLGYYLPHFRTVELNASFYRWPRPETFAGWRERLPEGFALTVKASRGLTHARKLNAPEIWLERMEAGLLELGDKMAVLLVQLPPQFGCNYDRLAYFLQQVPRWIRVAVEFRHESWQNKAIFSLLEQHQAGHCIMSGTHLPCILRATAPFVYVRLHGPDPNRMYDLPYSDDDLRWWADRIREWQATGHEDVYVYFNNDIGGHAVRNALTLKGMLGV